MQTPFIIFYVKKSILIPCFSDYSYLCSIEYEMNGYQSFSKRLTTRIVLTLTLVLIIVIAGITIIASRFIGTMTEAYFEHLADIENESVEKRLHNMQVAVQITIDEVEKEMSHPDSVYKVLSRKLQLNTEGIIGIGVGFEPNFYPEIGRWFEAYTMRLNDSVVSRQIGSASHDYFTQEWYVEGMNHDNGYWTNAYFFKEVGEPVMMCTYAKPIHDARGRKVGVYAGDLSLNMLHDYLLSKDLKANTEGVIRVSPELEGDPHQWVRSVIVGKNGYYLSHPDKERMLRDNFYEIITQKSDTVADRVVSDMKAGRKGTAELVVDGVSSTVFYSPLEQSDMSLLVILPKPRYYAVVAEFCLFLSSFLFVGLLAVYIICRHTIRRSTRPLQVLANSADEVAKGNFNAPLPDIHYRDEIGLLRDSFGNMQHSLRQYIDELKTTTAEKSAFERELNVARGIQMSMLPNTFPPFPERADIDIYASQTPARDVGGDLYDYFLRDNRLFFCIGDVSGKGMPAALFMAVIRAMFRSETRRADRAVAIMDAMNRNLSEEYTANYFATMFVGILDLTTGTLDYCNAGHEAPLVSGEPLPVKPNLPIGALDEWNYEGQHMQLKPDAMLFLYTDGISEAKNSTMQLLGRQTVIHLAAENTDVTAQELVHQMEAAVHHHAGDADQNDDITLLAIKWNPSQLPLTLSIKAEEEAIDLVKPYMARVNLQAPIEEKEAKHLRLAVEEAVINVINYGKATTILLNTIVTGDAIHITIDDDGTPFDPTIAVPTNLSIPADQRPPGGLGIILMRQMTDGLTYQRTDDGHNILTLIKKR